MKVLSLKQPFAELILQGKKTIELRKWNTNFRGEFLIHSSKIPNADSMKEFGFKELPSGFILGKVELVEVKHYANEVEHSKDKDKHLANSVWGSYGFVLKNPKRFDKPIPAKGSLNFWNFDSTKI
jgi:predicted transcriptional regulator